MHSYIVSLIDCYYARKSYIVPMVGAFLHCKAYCLLFLVDCCIVRVGDVFMNSIVILIIQLIH